jgi:hypothetical protein
MEQAKAGNFEELENGSVKIEGIFERMSDDVSEECQMIEEIEGMSDDGKQIVTDSEIEK